MPIYEYRCRGCDARNSVFFRSITVAENATPRCERCGSGALDRLISRTVIRKGVVGRLDEFDLGGALNDIDRSGMMDAGSFARWARKMSEEMGEEGGAKFRDLAEKAEAGADPLERVDPAHTLRAELNRQWDEATGTSSLPDDPFDTPAET